MGAFIMYVRKAFTVYQISLNKNEVQRIKYLCCYRKDSLKMCTQHIFVYVSEFLFIIFLISFVQQ